MAAPTTDDSLRLELERLVARWRQGDVDALGELWIHYGSWLRRTCSGRLNAKLRKCGDTEDYVQEVGAKLSRLEVAPPWVEDKSLFQALLARTLRNVLTDSCRRVHARKSPLDHQQSLDVAGGGQSRVLVRGDPSPSSRADRSERLGWTRLALSMLREPDRQAILLRHVEGLSFTEIGARLSTSEDGARMRYKRAILKVKSLIREGLSLGPETAT